VQNVGNIITYGFFVYVMLQGIFRETVVADGCEIRLEWYAHRVILPLLVLEIEVLRPSALSNIPLHIQLNVSQFDESPDINFTTSERFVAALTIFLCFLLALIAAASSVLD
jgi:hypothetical protein